MVRVIQVQTLRTNPQPVLSVYDADASDWFSPPTLKEIKEEQQVEAWLQRKVTNLGKDLEIQ